MKNLSAGIWCIYMLTNLYDLNFPIYVRWNRFTRVLAICAASFKVEWVAKKETGFDFNPKFTCFTCMKKKSCSAMNVEYCQDSRLVKYLTKFSVSY